MTEDIAAARGGHRILALVKGKTGVYASVNGGKPALLAPFTEGAESLTNETLLEMLDRFILPDSPTNVRIIGTRADGTAGWDGVDHLELDNRTGDFFTIEALSEAEALHVGYEHSTNADDFTVLSVAAGEPDQSKATGKSGVYGKGLEALSHHDGNPGVNAFVILATVVTDGTTRGSVRFWKQADDPDRRDEVKCIDVVFIEQSFGQIFTITGDSIASNPVMVAGLVESLMATHPDVTRVWIWSQDGLAHLPKYKPGSLFWASVRSSEAFALNDGKLVMVATALDIAQLASAPAPASSTASPQPANEAEGAETEE